MEGELSNLTRWAGTRQGGWRRRWERRQCLTRFSKHHCATCQAQNKTQKQKQNPPTQPARLDPGRQACRGPSEPGAGGGRAGAEPLALQAATSPAGPPAPLPAPARPHVAHRRRPLTVAPRSFPRGGPSTAAAVRAPPRGGARLARPQLPAPPQRSHSREKAGESALGRGRRKGGAANGGGQFCAASGGGGRHCASSPTSLLVTRRPSAPRKEAAVVWLRRARRSLWCASWRRVKSGGGGGGGGGEPWSASPPPGTPGAGRAGGAWPTGDPPRPVAPGGGSGGVRFHNPTWNVAPCPSPWESVKVGLSVAPHREWRDPGLRGQGWVFR